MGWFDDILEKVKAPIKQVEDNPEVKTLTNSLVDRRTNLTDEWAKNVGEGGVVQAMFATSGNVDSREGSRNRGVLARALNIGRPKDPEPAAPPPPGGRPVMPTQDSEAVMIARRRAQARLANRGGRGSTNLTGNEPLGG